MTLMAEGLADSHRSLASGEDFQDRMPEEDFHGSNVMNFDAAMPRRLPGGDPKIPWYSCWYHQKA